MKTLGIELVSVEAGKVEFNLPFQTSLTQQHGFIHAGITSTAMDSACGYAAFSLMPANAEVLTIEYKVNLLSPARGDSFKIIGAVLKAGRTVTVAQAEAYARFNGKEKLVAQMTGTLMSIFDLQTPA